MFSDGCRTRTVTFFKSLNAIENFKAHANMLTLRLNPANTEGDSKLAMVLRVIPWPLGGHHGHLFVKSKWPSKRRKDLESESLEMVCVEICPDKARNSIFGVVYKPPIMNPENSFIKF